MNTLAPFLSRVGCGMWCNVEPKRPVAERWFNYRASLFPGVVLCGLQDQHPQAGFSFNAEST